MIEVATHVAGSVAEAIEDARGLRATLRDAAAERGAVIAAAGTHPFSRWEHQDVTEHERYRELMSEMRWVAEREVIFGLHVHVGMASADAAIAVANGLRTWLPELLALSTNSPFWLGRDTGLGSTRTKIFETDDHPALRVAAGEIEAAVFFMGGPWDVAAPSIVVREAGGRFGDLHGGASIARGGGLFSNGAVHEAALAVVGRGPVPAG